MNDPLLSSKALAGSSSSRTYAFPAQAVEKGKVYEFTSVRTGTQFHNFFVKKIQEVTPVDCVRVADLASDRPVTVRQHWLTSSEKSQDMCFEFAVKELDGCPAFTGTVKSAISIETLP